jgi:hypothetical protein
VPSRSDPYELAADGPPGVEYVVALASPAPFRDLPWFLAETDQGAPPPETIEAGDDIDQGYVVGDPYVGMERLNRRIVPPGREGGVASSDTYFYIDRRVEYPRYVCADCHYHQPFFDPYGATCSVVDIRVDATWIHYSPVRWGIIRPRYYYLVRKTAPVRYRQSKGQWSSKDGSRLLRQRFIVSHELRGRTDVRARGGSGRAATRCCGCGSGARSWSASGRRPASGCGRTSCAGTASRRAVPGTTVRANRAATCASDASPIAGRRRPGRSGRSNAAKRLRAAIAPRSAGTSR